MQLNSPSKRAISIWVCISLIFFRRILKDHIETWSWTCQNYYYFFFLKSQLICKKFLHSLWTFKSTNWEVETFANVWPHVTAISAEGNMAGRHNNNRYISTKDEAKMFFCLIHEKIFFKNLGKKSWTLQGQLLILFPFCSLYFFSIWLQPHYGILLLLLSSYQTCMVYPHQPLFFLAKI